MRRLGRALRYLWALPNTVLGLVLALLSFQRPRVAGGVVVCDGPLRGTLWVLRLFGRTAITFGHVVLSNRPLEGRLLAHELHHVRQYEQLGPVYLPLYLLIWALTGYRSHPFELAASAAEAVPAPSSSRPAAMARAPAAGPAVSAVSRVGTTYREGLGSPRGGEPVAGQDEPRGRRPEGRAHHEEAIRRGLLPEDRSQGRQEGRTHHQEALRPGLLPHDRAEGRVSLGGPPEDIRKIGRPPPRGGGRSGS